MAVCVAIVLVCVGMGLFDAGTAYGEKLDAQGAVVRGRVTIRGPAPPAEPAPVLRDRAFCGETMPSESAQIDRASGGIADVVVSLEGVARGQALPDDRRTALDTRACRFAPHTQAVQTGSTLEVRNADPVLHNPHIRKSDGIFLNVAMPPGVQTIRKPLAAAGRLDVHCDAHPFMQATIHVFEHPYFAVTDAAGRFELTHVPPGVYRLRVWHETLGMREQSVTVSAAGRTVVNLALGNPR